jgi:hypothetical protein
MLVNTQGGAEPRLEYLRTWISFCFKPPPRGVTSHGRYVTITIKIKIVKFKKEIPNDP